MNDPGLGEVIQQSGTEINDARRHRGESESRVDERPEPKKKGKKQKTFKDDGEDNSIYQPTLWWFSSTAFPLFAGTFGPIANLFSVCALVQTWRVSIFDGSRVRDPPWLIALNACSLVFALTANIILLFNFARRIPYRIAQPLTITFWYLASLFLLLPICLSHVQSIDPKAIVMSYSQSYYYALISCILYFCVSTLLLVSTLGSTVFHLYKPSFASFTGPQRTLMLQTISFTLYLSLGAGIYSKIEGWSFTDAVYWADYTLLTVGLGSDFPPRTTLGRMLLIPYAAFGITLLGIVVSSVRGLVLERAKTKVARRHLGKERERWKENIKKRRHLSETRELHTPHTKSQTWRMQWKERRLMHLPRQFAKAVPDSMKRRDQQGSWHRAEFELMRYIEEKTESTERYAALIMSLLVVIVVWVSGSLIFWSCEIHSQSMTYTDSLYFTYTTLLTIGYGDFYPRSFAGKPFFVVWSLISVPAMTVLISNMGDTVVKWVQDVTVWASKWTILPEQDSSEISKTIKKGIHKYRRPQHRQLNSHHSRLGAPSKAEIHDNPSHENDSGDTSNRFQHDIEYLGHNVEGFEQEEGRGGSLAARLAHEISYLAKDLRSNPPKKYTWEEWERWLEMLGEREQRGGGDDEPTSAGEQSTSEASQSPAPHMIAPTAFHDGESQSTGNVTSSTPKDADSEKVEDPGPIQLRLHPEPTSGGTNDSGRNADHKWRWTWLDDKGPLFSELTETEWIIEKLCLRMEEVLEDEIREARESARHPKTEGNS